jgi:hypothetical protein
MKRELDPKIVRESIKLFYHSLQNDSLIQLEEYLKHTSVFLDSIKTKMEEMEIYSEIFSSIFMLEHMNIFFANSS